MDDCTIVEYRAEFSAQVIELILTIQNIESGVNIALGDQPDLLSIEHSYVEPGGGFWVALDSNDHVAGTIGLQTPGAGVGILKKFFVAQQYRGRDKSVSGRLFAALLAHAEKRALSCLVLDTPAAAKRSHAFYVRHGFAEITRRELPLRYDFPNRNSLFFLKRLRDLG